MSKNCTYCNQPVADEYDPETGRDFNYGYHWECVHENAEGEWIVRTTQNAVTPARVNERRYGTQKRAREIAERTRRENRREWPCGAQLDIVVTRQPVTV